MTFDEFKVRCMLEGHTLIPIDSSSTFYWMLSAGVEHIAWVDMQYRLVVGEVDDIACIMMLHHMVDQVLLDARHHYRLEYLPFYFVDRGTMQAVCVEPAQLDDC